MFKKLRYTDSRVNDGPSGTRKRILEVSDVYKRDVAEITTSSNRFGNGYIHYSHE